MRELTVEEFDEVAGGPGPLLYLAGAAIVAAGSAVGGYLAGKSAGEKSAQASATVDTGSGSVEVSCSASSQ
ncbi:hypothetical protein [Pseudoxanthomonas suwonensis]|uniref:hypothetical protein n=1 Tax=Pseudoxanthomonas suwonensis TaxID=314722 RepID=UPI000AC88AAA|nr:hypothetical protein [Pseudoxanthomonas suwonensis]